MKTTLYILTLFLLLQTGFGFEKIKPLEDHIFGGLTASYSNIENQNTVSFGVKMINNKYMKPYRNYQLDFASFDWQNQDFYNNGKTSYSYLLSSIKAVYIITILLNEKKLGKNEYVTIPFYALCGITNGKLGYTLIDLNTSKSSFLNTSIFAKSKLDYFFGHEQNWWRWKPGFGIEFSQLFGKRVVTNGGVCGVSESEAIFGLAKTYGISLEFGLEKPIDFGVANPQSNKLTPYVNFILLKGF